MADYIIDPSTIGGKLQIPSSKSHTLRAILFGALADGTTRITDYLPSPDTLAMIEAVRQLGAEVNVTKSELQVTGGNLQGPADVIQCGNSGMVLRFIGAIGGLLPHYTILTGDYSIRHNRPVAPLLDGLNQLGAFATSSRQNGYAPILVKGPFTKGKATIDGADSQPVSGLLIAAAFAAHPIELHVNNPGEKPWVDLTLNWLERLGVSYERQGYTFYRINGNSKINSFSYAVPGDFSTAAFPIAAALLSNAELTIENLDMEDCQGDKQIISILEQMGARFTISEKKITIHSGSILKGMKIDINNCIDALPILAVVGCFAEGTTEIVGGTIARKKESDRIACIATELKKMGAHIEERPDGLVIKKSDLQGAVLNSHHDHRIALALTVAALAAKSQSTLQHVQCVDKTYPTFFDDFRAIGAEIHYEYDTIWF